MNRMRASSAYGQALVLYRNTSGQTIPLREADVPMARGLHELQVTGVYNTGTNFAFSLFRHMFQPPCRIHWQAAFSNVSGPHLRILTTKNIRDTEEYMKGMYWLGGKHTLYAQPSTLYAQPTIFTSASCRGCALLIMVRHPLAWLHSMCKPSQSYGCSVGPPGRDANSSARCLRRIIMSRVTCRGTQSATATTFRTHHTMATYWAHWYDAHLRPPAGDTVARIWLRYEDLVLHANWAATMLCASCGMRARAISKRMNTLTLQKSVSPHGPQGAGSAAEKKAVDVEQTLYGGGMEHDLVRSIAHSIRSISPTLLATLGYTIDTFHV